MLWSRIGFIGHDRIVSLIIPVAIIGDWVFLYVGYIACHALQLTVLCLPVESLLLNT